MLGNMQFVSNGTVVTVAFSLIVSDIVLD
jgi:hypothetical protein